MHFQWTKVKLCFGIFFYRFTIFGFENAKNQLFEENKRYECSFYRIEVKFITNPSSQLENPPNALIVAHGRFFMIFFF